MSEPDYDLIIIGGGIHGVGLAQAGAAAGYRVLTLERHDWGWGTSSRSSKLIHGGLRYLQSGQLGLVRRCLQERQLLLRLAPALVHLQPFHIPVYRESRYRPWQLRLALRLYRALNYYRDSGFWEQLARDHWPEPGRLNRQGLQTVFRYYDAQTDDRQLTLAVCRSAAELGAEMLAPASFEEAERHARGYRVRFRHGHQQHRASCRVLVNAGGPWVMRLLAQIENAPPPLACDLVQGSHIVLPDQLANGCFYLEAPSDRRPLFMLPWQGNTLVGTTETLFRGDPERVAPLPKEIDYLLEAVAHYFPDFNRQPVDSFAGLRVLPCDNQRPLMRSRETLFQFDQPKLPALATIYGGKLTEYRATASRLLQQLRPSLDHERPNRARPLADTRQLPLTPPADSDCSNACVQ